MQVKTIWDKAKQRAFFLLNGKFVPSKFNYEVIEHGFPAYNPALEEMSKIAEQFGAAITKKQAVERIEKHGYDTFYDVVSERLQVSASGEEGDVDRLYIGLTYNGQPVDGTRYTAKEIAIAIEFDGLAAHAESALATARLKLAEVIAKEKQG